MQPVHQRERAAKKDCARHNSSKFEIIQAPARYIEYDNDDKSITDAKVMA
jgi:hypothetical protein